jgi:hypothetical protein
MQFSMPETVAPTATRFYADLVLVIMAILKSFEGIQSLTREEAVAPASQPARTD